MSHSAEELERFLSAPLRLTVVEAHHWLAVRPQIRESPYLTNLLLQAVERSGYDRGHAVATAECNATEPREERDE